MDLGLQGKVAVITGGSEGIGKASAIKLAEEGAAVVICARREDVLEAAAAEAREASGGNVTGVSTDVTDPAQLASLFNRVVETHGRLDILVNNAGSSAASYFGDVSDEEWQYDLDLKLFGAIRCSRLAIPHMRKQGGGRIVNVTAVAGKAPPGSSVPTSVSRAAGIALTKVMSKDYAPDQILVNTVCIGLIKSGQIDKQWMRDRESEPDLTRDEWYARRGKTIPVGRVGEASEAANVIAFLVSDAASYVTGSSIHIDGGSAATI